MDGTAGAGGVNDVTRILQIATAENINMDNKLVKVAVETSVQGSELGKGAAVDTSA